ncbi:hypothetical protein Tsubulata_008045, partial [Turnera subulata]
ETLGLHLAIKPYFSPLPSHFLFSYSLFRQTLLFDLSPPSPSSTLPITTPATSSSTSSPPSTASASPGRCFVDTLAVVFLGLLWVWWEEVESRVGLCARGLEGRRDWIVTASMNGSESVVVGFALSR